jgi:hypothetical protein
VAQDVDALLHAGAPSDASRNPLHDLLRQRLAVVIEQDACVS